jgi:hypothetical protein
MKTNTMIWVAAISLLAGFACGDDNSGDPEPDTKTSPDAGKGGNQSGGSGGRAGSAATGGNSSAGPGPGPGPAGSVECGSKTCTAPGGGFVSACCADAETETCGMSLMGAGCSVPEPGDARCPSVMGFVTLPSCCTDDGMCGINAAMFGMPGCIELSEAASRAQMSSASSFPEPRRCDASGTSADADAGASDTDGGT